MLDKALTWFINGWVGLIAALNLVAVAGFFYAASTLWDGLAKVGEIYNPLNIWNYLAEIVALSPALAVYLWRERRRRRQT